MRIHVSHALGIIWISASLEIFKKPINLKCLCFPKLFPYYGNPLFLCFGNCMNFCFIRKIVKTLNFEIFVFPYISLTIRIHFSHTLGIVWISASPKIFEKSITLECLFFSHTFSILWEFTFPIFWELYGFLLHPKYFRNP